MRRGLVTLAVVAALSGPTLAAVAASVTATVPNAFVRTCSHSSRRCTAYRQVNGRFNRKAPIQRVTRWVR